jgi:hypothetical protein
MNREGRKGETTAAGCRRPPICLEQSCGESSGNLVAARSRVFSSSVQMRKLCRRNLRTRLSVLRHVRQTGPRTRAFVHSGRTTSGPYSAAISLRRPVVVSFLRTATAGAALAVQRPGDLAVSKRKTNFEKPSLQTTLGRVRGAPRERAESKRKTGSEGTIMRVTAYVSPSAPPNVEPAPHVSQVRQLRADAPRSSVLGRAIAIQGVAGALSGSVLGAAIAGPIGAIAIGAIGGFAGCVSGRS